MWTRRPTRSLQAAVAASAFVLMAYLAPLVHLIGHRADHVHVGEAIVLLPAELAPHEPHADHDGELAEGSEPGHEHPHGHERPAPEEPDHGAGSFAHFGAFLGAPQARIQIVAIRTRLEPVAAPALLAAEAPPIPCSRPRGPPPVAA